MFWVIQEGEQLRGNGTFNPAVHNLPLEIQDGRREGPQVEWHIQVFGVDNHLFERIRLEGRVFDDVLIEGTATGAGFEQAPVVLNRIGG